MEPYKAPQFITSDHKGNTINIASYAGKKVLLYFYPQDMTSGCTVEALGFQENYEKFKELDTEILALSPDDINSHKTFCDMYGLQFPLLIDTDGIIAEQYGVLDQATKKEIGALQIHRESFLINEKGMIIKHWKTVDPTEHPQQVLEYIKNL